MAGRTATKTDIGGRHDLIEAPITRWREVAATMRARRHTLDVTQAEIVARSDRMIAHAVYGILERAGQTAYRRRALHGACRGLGWTDDSIERVLRGETPKIATHRSAPVPADVVDIEDTLRELVAHVSRLDEAVRRVLASLPAKPRPTAPARRAKR